MLTVLMSIYNSAAYLREAIQSTLAQTVSDFEFLIVDDGSADNSLEICREYQRKDNRIRIITHANWGAPAALNDAVAQANYDWIFRMDPDDVMLPIAWNGSLRSSRKTPTWPSLAHWSI